MAWSMSSTSLQVDEIDFGLANKELVNGKLVGVVDYGGMEKLWGF